MEQNNRKISFIREYRYVISFFSALILCYICILVIDKISPADINNYVGNLINFIIILPIVYISSIIYINKILKPKNLTVEQNITIKSQDGNFLAAAILIPFLIIFLYYVFGK